MSRPQSNLRLLIAAAIVVSLVHYADNTVRYDDYTTADPSLPGSLIEQWMIPVAWVLYTAIGILGYRRFAAGRLPQAAALIGAYSTSGLISALHYLDIAIDDLDAFQSTFVALDFALGAGLLAFALWIAFARPIAGSELAVSRHPGGGPAGCETSEMRG